MVREGYARRVQMLYFRSEKEKEEWTQAADDAGKSVSSYILEMASVGKSKREQPRGDSDVKIREELVKLRSRNQDLETIRENQEAEVLKLRHKVFMQANFQGIRQYSPQLIGLLKSGGAWGGREILKGLNVSPNDSEVVDIIMNMLRTLESYGFVNEDIRGWMWAND